MDGLCIECARPGARETDSIERILTHSILRWLGHVARMEDAMLSKQLLYSELTDGSRLQGGQRKRYKDMYHSALELAGIDKTWETSCKDRSAWRTVVYNNAGIFAKRRTHSQISVHDARSYEYDECGRIIMSRVGLISYCRTHVRN